MANLQPHQERVVNEEQELATKLGALSGFIGGEVFRNLSKDEQEKLLRQQKAMTEYHDILEERIEGFVAEAEGKVVESDVIAGELYEIYCAAVGGVAFNGDKLPGWVEFIRDPSKSLQSGGWNAIGERVVELIAEAKAG